MSDTFIIVLFFYFYFLWCSFMCLTLASLWVSSGTDPTSIKSQVLFLAARGGVWMWTERSRQILKRFQWMMGSCRVSGLPVTTFRNCSLSLSFVSLLCKISREGGLQHSPVHSPLWTQECSTITRTRTVDKVFSKHECELEIAAAAAALVFKPCLSFKAFQRGNLLKWISHWWAVGETLTCKCIHMRYWHMKLCMVM